MVSCLVDPWVKHKKDPPVSSCWDLSAVYAREELLGGSL